MMIASEKVKNDVAQTPLRDEAARYTVFKRQQQFFGLTINLVREVLPGQPLTRVARAPEHILGVLSLRGEILPVVVIDSWLGLPRTAENLTLPMLVLRQAELLVGLRVDAIQSVVNVPAAGIQPQPGGAGLLRGLWHPEGHLPITLIDDHALVEMLRQQTPENS
jgi:purine-binding chemotaxis protein CheW